MSDITQEEAQSRTLQYPEGGWIGVCGSYFPSEVQWLYKSFKKQFSTSTSKIPENSNTTYPIKITSDLVTLGSGTTTNGVPINEKVSLDWLKYAIQTRFWKLLYNNERITATKLGETAFLNELIAVLNIAVNESIIVNYKINSVSLDRVNGKISISFRAELVHTILSVNVSGSLYK